MSERPVFFPLLFSTPVPFCNFRLYPSMNRLITFEGIEGCGKTTQIKMAGDYLAAAGVPFIITEEPGGTPLGKKIREILLNRWPSPLPISPASELLLFFAARSQHVVDVILPALKEGKWILCDRFLDATLAYQGFGRGLDIDFIKSLHDFLSASLKPALTILLDLPVDVGLRRAMDRIAHSEREGAALEDRFEREEAGFLQKIRDGYLSLAKEEPMRYRIIDASRDIRTVHREVCDELDAFMKR